MSPIDLAARLVGRAPLLESALRKSLRDPLDPTALDPSTTLERIQLRQLLDPELGAADGMRVGIELWDSGSRYIGRSDCWDRTCGYAVLCYLAPERAVRLAEELQDADFVLAVAGTLHRRIREWSLATARAFCRSSSPTIRALGLQALAHESFNSGGPGGAVVPSDLVAAIDRLAEEGARSLDIALLLACWGTHRQSPAVQAKRPIDSLVKLTVGLSVAEREVVLSTVLDENFRSGPALDALVELLEQDTATPSTELCEQLVVLYLRRWRPERELHFHAGDAERSRPIALALRIHVQRCGSDAWTVLSERSNRNLLEKRARRLSLFRHRTDAGNAELAYGVLILLDLCASAEPKAEEGKWTVGEHVMARTMAYLESPRLGNSRYLREYLQRLLSEAFVET